MTGSVVALGPPRILNREDFVWDMRLSPDARSVALARLGLKSFHMTVFDLDVSGKARADIVINPLEFNVEALDWSPEGAFVAAVSRDRSVRLYEAASSFALKGAWLTDEPLTSVAFDPGQGLLAVGSAKGLLTVLTSPDLGFVAEQRGHSDEVSGLAWSSQGELFSSSWDRSVSVWVVQRGAGTVGPTRVRYEKVFGQPALRAVLDGKLSVSVVFDGRLPVTVVRSEVAQLAGLDLTQLTESITIPTPLGSQVSRLARGLTLAVKGLSVVGVEVAICDACVPKDVQGVVGKPFLDRVDLATDEATQEFVLSARPGASDVTSTGASTLTRVRQFRYPASVNDVSLDAQGQTMALALSESKAQRTRSVYEREKRKEVEPERPWDCAARVDAKTGVVIETLRGHRGVVATAGISPDGKTVVSGGWDKRVLLHRTDEAWEEKYGWAIRRVRFSRDGRWVTVAAWTPQNPLNDHQSDPAAVVYEAVYAEARVVP
jgi:WD40 repeat protein